MRLTLLVSLLLAVAHAKDLSRQIGAPIILREACTDTPPPSGTPGTSNSPSYTCGEQKVFGACDAPWMSGFCRRTCGQCSDGLNLTPAGYTTHDSDADSQGTSSFEGSTMDGSRASQKLRASSSSKGASASQLERWDGKCGPFPSVSAMLEAQNSNVSITVAALKAAGVWEQLQQRTVQVIRSYCF
jgi:hypothetical protein